MARKKKEEIEIEEIKAPIPPLSPLFSNSVAIWAHSDMVMLDFGFVGPSYREPYGFEDSHMARMCLDWDAAENLVNNLSDAISDHKKVQESKRKAKSKK